MVNYPIHSREKIKHISMFYHHTLGFSRGARGVDDITEVFWFNFCMGIRRRLLAKFFPDSINGNNPAGATPRSCPFRRSCY